MSRGDSVAFLIKSCPEFVYATFGCLQLGAIWIPVNVDYRGAWLRAALEDAAARVLVGRRGARAARGRARRLGSRSSTRSFAATARRQSAAWPVLAAAEIARRAGKVAAPEDPGTGPGDTACVLWTSGTTGRSKGVMQSHNVWIRAALSGAENSGIREGDALYSCLPMYNSAAWVAHIYRALVSGVPVGLDRSSRCRRSGTVPTLRCDADLHARHDAHLPVAGARARRRRGQPRAPRGLRTDARLH